MRTLTILLCLLLTVFPPIALASEAPDSIEFDLPKLGLAGGNSLPLWEAHFVGKQVYYSIQQQHGVLNDPLVDEFINYLGHRLSSVANGPNEPFYYFPVKSQEINAFTLPGAFIGINTALILATKNEDELAAVMAHETGHAVQRHIARQLADSKYNSIVDLAMLIGAIAIAGISGNPDLGIGGLMSAQGGAEQRQLNYTRADEYAADRVGIEILARAHFSPEGMVDFFKQMQENYRLNGFQMPQFLSTHPLDLTRMSEAENRARSLHIKPAPEDPSYALMRARIRVLTSQDLSSTLQYFQSSIGDQTKPWYRTADRYGEAVAMIQMGNGKPAVKIMKHLTQKWPNILAFQIGLGNALIAAGQKKAGLAQLANVLRLNPDDLAALESDAQALLNSGEPKKAMGILLSPSRTEDLHPELDHMLAIAANQVGDDLTSKVAMARYFACRGQYQQAIIQLRLALKDNRPNPVEHTRIVQLMHSFRQQLKEAKELGLTNSNNGSDALSAPSAFTAQPYSTPP